MNQLGLFFHLIYQDPTLSAPIKLIAEPWNLGSGGFKSGWKFPTCWAEVEWQSR